MSYFSRSGENANAAILVNITPEDFGDEDVLAGVRFQRKWEHLAYRLTDNYAIPIQKVGDFIKGHRTKELGDVKPANKSAVEMVDLNKCLPVYVAESIKEALPSFDNRIRGFKRNDAILSGVETRSSSPIRMIRDEEYMSNIKGIYPCGEGAGYAGGIMSAAMDGIKVAEAIIADFQK
jgi:uncharacterized FAD-dependent dehydrogenase